MRELVEMPAAMARVAFRFKYSRRDMGELVVNGVDAWFFMGIRCFLTVCSVVLGATWTHVIGRGLDLLVALLAGLSFGAL